ncbi:Crp/Fnr family transcriptional regulator [Solihabitans fulvus]|uniref:Crp/Fnr family transcriptional regulator n=1 Tax=Solihabitans fulvus TaxID=1892852 RepID=A0A5B2WS88_9PSEU|nr:Crp/Fnr family transcriptional regulator [Solihabitans fulvus]KAA2253552.1 Crp/Fnr family transcriptional regulator [Solihabitans fulvus]
MGAHVDSPDELTGVEASAAPVSGEADAWPAGSLLGRLSDSVRSALLMQGRVSSFPAGTTLVREGETSTHVLVLMTGMVKVTATTEGGHTTLLAIRVAGDIIGELAPIDSAPRSASVVAAVPTRAVIITGEAFLGFLAGHPVASLEMMRALSAKLRSATSARVAAGSYTVVARLAQVLRELSMSYGEKRDGLLGIGVPLSQADLAALVGASDAAIHKALRVLRECGAIDTGYRRIVVRDEVALNAMAEQTG